MKLGESCIILVAQRGWRGCRWKCYNKDQEHLLAILVPLLAGRDSHLSAKGSLYFACVHSVIRYGNETWPLKEGVIRLERNDARIVRCICKILSEDIISAEELRTRLNWRAWRNVYRIQEWKSVLGLVNVKLKGNGSFTRGQPWKHGVG